MDIVVWVQKPLSLSHVSVPDPHAASDVPLNLD
jgi:hypothetical protein